MQQILRSTGFDTSIAKNLHGKKKHEKDSKKVQWAKFTYIGKDTGAIAAILLCMINLRTVIYCFVQSNFSVHWS